MKHALFSSAGFFFSERESLREREKRSFELQLGNSTELQISLNA